MIDMESILEASRKLRPISSSVTRLIEVTSATDVDLDEVAKIIESDLGLVGVVLRRANSSVESRGVVVGDAKTAVVRLGTGVILSIATGHAFREDLTVAIPEYGLQDAELWRHSLATAISAEFLQDFCGTKIPREVYTAAFLHDIGKLALRMFITEDIAEEMVRFRNENPEAPFLEAERAVLGVTHAEVGARISKDWKLPSAIVEGIEWHHDPDQAKSPVSDAVHLANLVAKTIGEGLGTEGLGLRISSDAAERLEFSPKDFERVCSFALWRFQDSLACYGKSEACNAQSD